MSEHRLREGFELRNFRIEGFLGEGGFGITYRALDLDLQRVVAIKEYFPREHVGRHSTGRVEPVGNQESLAIYQHGLRGFVDEARSLARFDHPNIVRVHGYLEEMGTAYLIMEYVRGQTLSAWLQGKQPPIATNELLKIFNPILQGLYELHGQKLIHRDIKPANIYIAENGRPVLLDFGAARQWVEGQSKSLTAIVTPGYAPFEQYSVHGNQGPWTDIYSVAACLSFMLTGERVVEALDREMRIGNGEADPLLPLDGRVDSVNCGFLQAIDHALARQPADRPDNALSFLRALEAGAHGGDSNSEPRHSSDNNSDPDLPRAYSVALPGGLELDMVLVPGGAFLMGTERGGSELLEDHERQHLVTVEPFAIGACAITFEQYDAYVEASNAANAKGVRRLFKRKRLQHPDDLGWGRARRPVINVDLSDAMAYVDWLSRETGRNFRLPSEAEWEYAARSGTSVYNNPGNNDCDVGWFNYQNEGKTVATGSYRPNGFGLYEMLGNVWEWTGSVYDKNYVGDELHSERGESGPHALRGGLSGWRATVAERKIDNGFLENIGFRVVESHPVGSGSELVSAADTVRRKKEELKRRRLQITLEWQRLSSLMRKTRRAVPHPVHGDHPGELSLDLVWLPGGRFQMGSPEDECGRGPDERQHWVTIKPFAIGVYAVTFEQYDCFVDMVKEQQAEQDSTEELRRPGGLHGRGCQPVVDLSRNDALKYIDWLSHETGQNFRLPSEAEWEYAARAGSTTAFHTGETIDATQARFNDGTGDAASSCKAEVGAFPPNKFGLHEMHGNVWEWTASTYDEDYQGAEIICDDDIEAGVVSVRGGCWAVEQKNLRAAVRGRASAELPRESIGFRVAMS